MSYKRVWILGQPHLIRVVTNRLLICCFFLGVVFSISIGWNDHNITLFKLPIPISGLDNDKEKALESVFHEAFSWFWVIIAIFSLPSHLLSPLRDSFFVNQILWLRFTPCLPIEIAMARVILVISWGAWLGVLGILWTIWTVSIHQFSPKVLLIDVGGLVSYIFFTGSIVITLCELSFLFKYLKNNIPFIAFMLPIIIYTFFITFEQIEYLKFMPVVLPFLKGSPDTELHFITAFLIGLFLLKKHILGKLFVYSVSQSNDV